MRVLHQVIQSAGPESRRRRTAIGPRPGQPWEECKPLVAMGLTKRSEDPRLVLADKLDQASQEEVIDEAAAMPMTM